MLNFFQVPSLELIEVASHLSINGNRSVQVKLDVLHLEDPRIFVSVLDHRMNFLLRSRTHHSMSHNTFSCRTETHTVPQLKLFSRRCLLAKRVNTFLT